MSNKTGVAKSHRGTAKRMKLKKAGTVTRGASGKRHGLMNQTSSQRKRKRGAKVVSGADARRAKQMLMGG
tara:strand:- start:1263 stop:1472 length:210 start_codon:yes stop_codon:yes gene_type:complete